jgi:hypothetical protein
MARTAHEERQAWTDVNVAGVGPGLRCRFVEEGAETPLNGRAILLVHRVPFCRAALSLLRTYSRTISSQCPASNGLR